MDSTRQQHSPPASSASSPPQTQGLVSWPEGEEAEKMLSRYRRVQMHIFPFVIIPSDTTSASLRLERPFTWKALMLQCCSNDGHRQHVLGKELLQEFSEALLTRPRKSLDLLQGLILFVAWHHAGLTSFQATNLLGLTRSLCLSLGIHEGQVRELETDLGPLCLEKLRAFAGTYYLITSFYTTSKRTDAFMNTTYLDSLCRVLEDKALCPTDKLVAYMVKVQQLAQNISLTLSSSTTSQLFLLPMVMVVKSLQSQIESFKTNIPVDLRDNVVLASHLYTAETLLYEVGLQDVSVELGGLQGTDRLEVLWSLFTSLKAFLSLRFDPSGKKCHGFPCISSVDFMYNFLTCLKLITLQAPGWDLARIRRELALPDLADQQIQELERLIHLRKRGNNEDMQTSRPSQDPLQRLATTLKNISAVLRAMPEPGPMTPLVQNETESNDEDADLLDLDFVSTLVPDAWSGFWAPEDQNGDWNAETPLLGLSSE
ncbi:hypothetical protein PFICI_03428 [Pestalotiopsis fici W106-1]|uniref:Transcription factor domain-containing protein n=1 Tax=Pestalotiopsis fici (strain W106-1 / CGMCC3.15140) TaxID=1229662 RepID=W3XH36_PESFW|nr:uncharacterized protein PFICI_03428 [Pestalotiopsis fici W106-1]ETS85403.1 hypothetical protein PFICI_03428 [Pestalotiopsis fici W106-1]